MLLRILYQYKALIPRIPTASPGLLATRQLTPERTDTRVALHFIINTGRDWLSNTKGRPRGTTVSYSPIFHHFSTLIHSSESLEACTETNDFKASEKTTQETRGRKGKTLQFKAIGFRNEMDSLCRHMENARIQLSSRFFRGH